METKESLKKLLKHLRLGGLLPTLAERASYAKKTKLGHVEFLELLLQDEVERRENKKLQIRLQRAGFDEPVGPEEFDWDTPVQFDRERVRELFNLSFLAAHQDVLLLGPVGVGKTHLAHSLGHLACRAGYSVLTLRADKMLRELLQARADNSYSKAIRRLLLPDLLIVDDFGLRPLDVQQSGDLYDVIIERHRRSSTILTSNRAVEEWVPLFADPLLAQSAIDRIAHNAYQVVMEGESYRAKLRPELRVREPEAKPVSRRKRTRRRTA